MKKIFFILLLIFKFSGKTFSQATDYQAPTYKPLLGDIHFGNRVGGEIAQEGITKKLICLEDGYRLQSIQVNITQAKNVVKGLKMSILNNNNLLKEYVFGDTLGIWEEKINLKKSQKLVGISGTMGWFIDSICFHFSDGTKTKRFGGNGGDIAFQNIFNRDKKGNYKGRWIGFWGSTTDQLETIGLVFMAVE
ncbi:MAG: hypothetical protein RLZZ306_667 [Bacteroidota bacterium]|jgi:hypothetical protein